MLDSFSYPVHHPDRSARGVRAGPGPSHSAGPTVNSTTLAPPDDRLGRGTRLALAVLAFALYLGAFPLLVPHLGAATTLLVLGPVLAVAQLGGPWAGLGAAALGLALNTLLLNLAGAPPGGWG